MMGAYDDATEMKERMLEHESIAKAKRVYQQQEHAFDADEIADEYCEFMVLKILSGDFSATNAKLSPGGAVDAFWHCHILDTVGYSAFFKAVLPPLGPMVHHDAEKSQDSQTEIGARQEKTKELYQTVFKEECPFFNLSGRKRNNDTRSSDSSSRSSDSSDSETDPNPSTIQIQVKKHDGQTFSVDIRPEQTIHQLKSLIHQKEHVPVDDQQIIFRGRRLEDAKTIADLLVIEENGTTVYLVIRSEATHGQITITLKTLTGKTLHINIGRENTIRRLKTLIQDREGIPSEQQIIVFASQRLNEDGRTIADCGIANGSIVMLVLDLRGC